MKRERRVNHHRSSLWTPRQARVSESPPLYAVPEMGESRWATPENPGAEKGRGGRTNRGAKGCPFASIGAGETLQMLDVEGAGVITRIWLTLSDRDPVFLRSLRLDMFWDDAPTPAVSLPHWAWPASVWSGEATPSRFVRPSDFQQNCPPSIGGPRPK